MEHNKFNGLNDQEVLQSRQTHGTNRIEEKPPATLWERIKEGFEDPMIRLLCIIAAIMMVMCFFGQAEWYEPVGTIVAILLVTVISAKTGMASDDEYRKLKDSTKAESIKVYRNGVITTIDIEDLVVGDTVILQSGDKIPADGILIDGELSVDNSALNGETEECKKTAASADFEMTEEITGDTFVDKHSLFRGATSYNGEGLMEIKRVGMKTMMGKMAEDMQDDEVDSPLKVKLAKLASQISTFGYIGAIVIAVVYIIHFVILAGGISAYMATGGINILKDIIEAVTIAVVIIVCSIPEGLPLMISLVLMQNTGKMLQHNVLVRKAIGIETAGSLNILFSDKTGTITKGKLEVTEFFTGDGKVISLNESKAITDNMNLAIGKNTAAMFDDNHKVIGGNATDQALMHFLTEDTYRELAQNEEYKVTEHQSFNSANKFSQAHIESLGKTFYKGAPEKLMEKATKYLAVNGEEKEINKEKVNVYIDHLAGRAMRVLAFGYSKQPMVNNEINDDIVIVGFVGIRDDVRPEAKKAIEEVKEAGIQVVMITGDRKETAVAIAKEAGLIESDNDIALTSAELNAMTDDEVKAVIPRIRVISRALPTDKSRMVRLCQELNLVTGMTGDGVNDAPALKRADVGFGMGSGTDVAKEASDLVILDDNFQSIKDAVLYGRTIYKNILKFCTFQLSINIGAVLLSSILPFIGIEEPLTVTHLLFVNLCMDSLGALLLGQEPALDSYMKEPPKRRDESIVNKKMATQFISMGIYLLALALVWFNCGIVKTMFQTEAELRTSFFAVFMFSAIMNGWNVRNTGINIFEGISENKNFIKVMAAMMIAVVLIASIPGLNIMFNCVPISIVQWLVILAISVIIIPVDMIRKMLTR